MAVFRRIKDKFHQLKVRLMAREGIRKADRTGSRFRERLREKKRGRDDQGPIAPIH